MTRAEHVTETKATMALAPMRVEGWTLFADHGAHLMDTLELAERAGLKVPRDVTRTVEAAIADGLLSEVNDVGAGHIADVPFAIARKVLVPIGNTGGFKPSTRWLVNEAGAVALVMRLRTDKSVEITRAIIRVFLAVARGNAPQTVPASAEGIAMAVSAVFGPMLHDALAPILGRIAAIEQHPAGGVVTGAVATHIKRSLTETARILVACGQAKSLRSGRTRLENRLRGALGWAGTGCSWARLPAAKHGEALRELDVMRRMAEGIRDALAPTRQLALRAVK